MAVAFRDCTYVIEKYVSFFFLMVKLAKYVWNSIAPYSPAYDIRISFHEFTQDVLGNDCPRGYSSYSHNNEKDYENTLVML